MKHTISLFGRLITLNQKELPDEVDVDELTTIDHSNISGEIATISAALNKIGQLRAEAERIFKQRKLDADVFESNLRKKMRMEASKQAGKFYMIDGGEKVLVKLTEGSLAEAVMLNKPLQEKKEAMFDAERDLGYLDALHWSVQSKSKKLDNMMKGVTPEEFVKDLVEGTINGIFIKKVVNKYLEK